jgi:hypothetical protein
MPSSDLPEVFAAQVLFWLLLPVALFAPTRWAVLAWLVMGNLDATGPGQSPTESLGWLNAVKSILVPVFLAWRLRGTPSKLLETIPARLWLVLTAYAAVATLWSPFPLAAAKLVGNMIGIALTLVVLEKASRERVFDARALTLLILTSLALGAVQTYYYGGAAYGFDGFDQPSRFSSFVAAQQYAAFLVCFIAVLLWQPDLSKTVRSTLGVVVLTALVLNGSRIWFLGAGAVVIVYSWFSSRRILGLATMAASTVALGAMLVVSIGRIDGIEITDSSNRILATATAVATGVDTPNSVGLRDLSFRSRMYNGVLEDLRASDNWQILLGHGTSSGGSVALRIFPETYKPSQIDANRVIHNEWLRAFYEWGVIGLCLLAACLFSFPIGVMVRAKHRHWKRNAPVVLAFFPAFLASLSTENVIAGAGNAVTMSLALVVALLWTPPSRSWEANG